MSEKRKSEVMTKEDAMAIYTPPFKFQRGYIFDAKGNNVADNPCEDAALRIRGWGRISYMPHPEQLQDKIGELVAEALTEYWMKNDAQKDNRNLEPNNQSGRS